MRLRIPSVGAVAALDLVTRTGRAGSVRRPGPEPSRWHGVLRALPWELAADDRVPRLEDPSARLTRATHERARTLRSCRSEAALRLPQLSGTRVDRA